MRKFSLLAVVLLATAVTYAGGYRVSLQGQRSLAMGHTGVAVVNNAEIAFFNPAGIVYLENKLNAAVGVSGVFSDVAWQNEEFGQYAQTESPMGTPFYAYVTYSVTDWMSVGLAAYTPYGSAVEWPTDWAGSHLVNNIDLQAIYIQPLVSFKISEYFSIGGGPIYVTGAVNFNRNLNRTLADAEGNRSNVTIEANGVSEWGWSAGFMFNPTEELRVGFHYRSEIILNAEGGEANFENVPDSPLTNFPDTTFDAALPMPAELAVGVSYEFGDKWLVAVDLNRTFWSVYNSLDIDFADDAIPDSKNVRNYANSNTYRFGVQYKALQNLTLRAGYYLDKSPVKKGYFAPETPRNDAQGFTGGLSYDISSKFAVDLSFLYMKFDEIDASYDYYAENGQEVPFGGTYKSTAFVPGIGITYKL
ncbi:MAG TPA: outer membrane protein transport protein [Salinimicrobium sp.]|nr:outer membrane protein transport protein [Salinimicrobium sp.]